MHSFDRGTVLSTETLLAVIRTMKWEYVMLQINNIYGHGFPYQEILRLTSLGFNIRPQSSTYEGCQLCRFVDFDNPPSLEFIEVTDEKEYLEFVPKGMTAYCPGIEFVILQASQMKIGDFKQTFSQLRPYTVHVNYDETGQEKSLGWNYLNFEEPIVEETFIWLAEWEEPRPVKPFYDITHPNTVTDILGFVFDLDMKALDTFTTLVNTDFTEGVLTTSGLNIWLMTAINDFPDVGKKMFPLIAVILKAEQLDYFKDTLHKVKKISFQSRPAIYIATNQFSWDLVITT